jgi:diaminohydroxyphosphoribosylaminopyrimidine deaminase/5-amino-6-(5-phosphoribosylamino)uracil reductase
MERAARIAARGHGNVEPNPMVGCVILDANGTFVAEGYHRKFGQAHAEVDALRRAGDRARGGTAVVTLEPCNHRGKTGPCSHALAEAGIARVVYACQDPNGPAAGGAAYLRSQGVTAELVACPAADMLNAPFLHSLRTGLPWVSMKWAQTADGRIATRTDEPRWISGPRSRAMVHAERGRVDAILTGIGTVLTDDPLLTARDVQMRRVAKRVVWDPRQQLPVHSKLVQTARSFPLIVGTITPHASSPWTQAMTQAGATVIPAADLNTLLRALHQEHRVWTMLVEAGAGLVGQLMEGGLVNEAWIFIAPPAPGSAHAFTQMPHAAEFALVSRRMRGPDTLLHYRRPV